MYSTIAPKTAALVEQLKIDLEKRVLEDELHSAEAVAKLKSSTDFAELVEIFNKNYQRQVSDAEFKEIVERMYSVIDLTYTPDDSDSETTFAACFSGRYDLEDPALAFKVLMLDLVCYNEYFLWVEDIVSRRPEVIDFEIIARLFVEYVDWENTEKRAHTANFWWLLKTCKQEAFDPFDTLDIIAKKVPVECIIDFINNCDGFEFKKTSAFLQKIWDLMMTAEETLQYETSVYKYSEFIIELYFAGFPVDKYLLKITNPDLALRMLQNSALLRCDLTPLYELLTKGQRPQDLMLLVYLLESAKDTPYKHLHGIVQCVFNMLENFSVKELDAEQHERLIEVLDYARQKLSVQEAL